MTTEDSDRIERAEEIQRYTENRCEALEKENAELKKKWLQATDEGTSWAHLKRLEGENIELKTQVELLQMNIEKMKNSLNCQIWNGRQCPYARNNEKNYVHPNGCDCPCDKWKIKVV